MVFHENKLILHNLRTGTFDLSESLIHFDSGSIHTHLPRSHSAPHTHSSDLVLEHVNYTSTCSTTRATFDNNSLHLLRHMKRNPRFSNYDFFHYHAHDCFYHPVHLPSLLMTTTRIRWMILKICITSRPPFWQKLFFLGLVGNSSTLYPGQRVIQT